MGFRIKVPLLPFELRSPSRITRRRTAVATFVVVVTATGSFLMGDLLWGLPLKGSAWVIWSLFTLLFGLLAFGASQAAFGFLARRGKGDRATIFRTLPDDPSTVPLAPTAIVLPVYNEEVTRVFAGLRAIYQSIERTGQLEHFDFFILSDSTDPEGGAGLGGTLPRARRARPHFLPQAPHQLEQEGRQPRRLPAPLGPPLPLHGRARRG
jgi:membrane glycosyltransferase